MIPRIRRNDFELSFCIRGAAILFVLIFCVSTNAVQNNSTPSNDKSKVEIIRDTWGIPHIFAQTDAGAMFGLGYACAEDRLFQMEYSRRVVQGRLAEMLGDIGSRGKSTVDSDIFNRRRQFYPHCEKLAKKLDKKTRKLLEAYCDGVNKYVQEHSGELHYLFGKYGVTPEPWTVADCLAAWTRIAGYFSPSWANEAKLLHDFEDLVDGGMSEAEAKSKLTSKRIIDEEAAVVKESDVDSKTRAEMEAYARKHGYSVDDAIFWSCPSGYLPKAPKFSHAWVVGKKKSTTGAAVLHSDPQTAVRNPSLWYEYHFCGKTSNTRGIGIAGCPGLLIGWNENVAWGATALGADMADIFRLETSGRDGTKYVYDGKERTIESWEENIYVRGEEPRRIILKKCHIGPVVSEAVTHRRAGEEYALKTSFLFYTKKHTVQALFKMMRAKNARKLGKALNNWIEPGVHFLFGDGKGNIGYWTKAGIPLRSTLSPFLGHAAQYGNGKKFDWIEIIPHKYLPHVLNPSSGVLYSGNHLPVGGWYPLPLHVGTGGGGHSQRSYRLSKLLTGEKKFKPDDVLAIHFDDVNQAIFEILKAGYHIQANRGSLSRNAESLLDILKDWYEDGAHCDSSEPYFAGAYHIKRLFRQAQAGGLHDIYGGGDGGLCYFLRTLSSKLGSDSQYTLTEDENTYIDNALAAGWATAVSKYGSNPDSWKAAFRKTTARLHVPYFTTLEGFPSLDPSKDFFSRPLHDPEGATIWSQKGNSYSQWVDLSYVDGSLALLPVGISENPNSTFNSDEQELWEEGKLRAAPLSREAVEKIAYSNATLIYKPPSSKAIQ